MPVSDERRCLNGVHDVVDVRGDLRARDAVDVQRDGGCVAAIAEPVNAAPAATHKRHGAGITSLRSGGACAMLCAVPFEDRFAQRALQHRVAAPGVVCVHRACLVRQPYQRGDRIAAVRVGGQQMTAVVFGGASRCAGVSKAGFAAASASAMRMLRAKKVEFEGSGKFTQASNIASSASHRCASGAVRGAHEGISRAAANCVAWAEEWATRVERGSWLMIAVQLDGCLSAIF